MIGTVKSAPVREVRIVQAQRCRLVVHQAHELRLVTADVFAYLKTLPESPPAKDIPLLNERQAGG